MKKKIITTSILIFFSFLSFFACFKFAQNLDYTLRTDALNYHTTAINLIQKGYFGYPIFEGSNAYITPFYPLFLALIYKLFGLGNILAVQIIQSLLLIASGILTYFIIKKITDKRIFSIIGAIIYLIYPPFIAGSMQLLTETLYNFCFLLYLFFVIKYLQFPSSGGVPRRGGVVSLNIISGALFAICTLIRPTLFPLLILPHLIKFVQQKFPSSGGVPPKEAGWCLLKDFLWYLLAVIIVMFPWWLRNIIVLKEFIMLATQGGNPLLYGTFPYMNGIETYTLPAGSTESSEGIARLITGFLTQPLLYFKWFTIGKFNMIFYNIWYYLPGDGFAQGIPYFNDFLKIVHYGIVSLGFVGIGYGLFNKKIVYISAYTILIICAHLLVIPTERYAITIIPLLIISSAWLLSRVKLNN